MCCAAQQDLKSLTVRMNIYIWARKQLELISYFPL